MRKRNLLITLAIVVLGAGAAWYLVHRSKGAAAPVEELSPTAVSRGNIVSSVSSAATVTSNLDVSIKCRASGEVIKLPFDISDGVKAGQLLLQLDPADENRAVTQAQVQVAISQSKLTEAQANENIARQNLLTARHRAQSGIESAKVKADNLKKKADREKLLYDQKLVSEEEFEAGQTDASAAANDLAAAQASLDDLKSLELGLAVKAEDIKLAQEQLKSDQLSLDNANQLLAYTTVLAPMDGVVSALTIEKGTIISSAISNVGGGTTVMTLSDLSHIFVLATVDESDIGGVQPGQKVLISADSFPNEHFTGKVVRIAPQGVSTSNVVTFEVKIEVTSDNHSLLKPAMTTTVKIVEAEKTGVLLAPQLAVLRKGGKRMVTVVKSPGQNEDREVQTGISDDDNIEIIAGLKQGEVILVHKIDSTSKWAAPAGPR